MKKHHPNRHPSRPCSPSHVPAPMVVQLAPANLLPVPNLHAVRERLDESQRLTGDRARRFVIAGADRIAYQLCFRQNRVTLLRIDDQGGVMHTARLQPAQVPKHNLFEAMRCGQLFTPALSPIRTSH